MPDILYDDGKGTRIEGERADERNSPFHKKIVGEQLAIPHTKTGRHALLECGHVVHLWGVESPDGKALCMKCRDGVPV